MILLPIEDAQMVMDHFDFNNGDQESEQLMFETHLIKRDKSDIPVEIKSRAIHYIKGKAVLNVARDITPENGSPEDSP